ncbi:betaine/choline/glycine transport protein [Klebsiella pneumoniae]|uniref:Betaine/choline/glycine transport protein n=1 Tax=Klebsiella pneumoniae TaxID=573 RepID=A0A447S567_KLEPN|nr:betaine/choline/glycine transport protein [Klebsiella pneumoniae]
MVLLVGPTEFITNNIINAVGLTTQNFLQMSLFTDPLGGRRLYPQLDRLLLAVVDLLHPRAWRCSSPASPAGGKIKEVIWGLLLGSTAGCWFFFGVMESYAMAPVR